MLSQIKNIIFIFFETLISLKSGIFKYILLSGFVALLIFASMFWVAWHNGRRFSGYLESIVPWDWARDSSVFGFIIGLTVILGFLLILKYILLILLSPLLSSISENLEKSLRKDYKVQGVSMALSTARSVRINMRNLVKEFFISILLLIVGLLPGVGIITLPILFLVQAYFTGFGIVDFYLERHFTFRQTLVEVYRNKYAATTLGGIFMLLFTIPVIGVIIGPYLTTVTGTKYFLKNNQM